jgi:hypothetical protein
MEQRFVELKPHRPAPSLPMLRWLAGMPQIAPSPNNGVP